MSFILTKLGLMLPGLILFAETSSHTAFVRSTITRFDKETIAKVSHLKNLVAQAERNKSVEAKTTGDFLFRQSDQPDHYILQGHVFPNLVEVEAFTVHLWAHGMDAAQEIFEGSATLQVTGTLGHPFESSVRNVEVRYVLIPNDRLEATWKRLTASPLQLTDTELRQSLPRPWLNWGRAALKDNKLAPSERQDLRLSTEYQEMVVRPDDLPAFLATLDGYTLENPTASDIQRIILYGGVIDLFAIVQWVESKETTPEHFAVEERRSLMEAIRARLMAMRAPPGLGDHMRLHAIFVLIRALATPENLEFLLSMNSSVEALLQSAGLSFHDALDDENRIELPIHKIREVPSLVQYMDAYKRAMEDIRRVSIPRLLELAYDPLDFRQAPPDLGLAPSKVQVQARGLLEPLIPTSVGTVLAAVEDNVVAQKQILEHYIRVRHAPAIVPIMSWLQDNPDELGTIGVSAAQQLGSSAVPTLMRYYIDNIDQRQRDHARAMLLALPASAGAEVIRAIRSSGIMLRSDATVQQALEAFEKREQAEKHRKAKELSERAFSDSKDAKGLSARLRAILRLKEVEPEKLEGRSEEIIEVLGLIAKTLDQPSPVESAQALDLLQNLPFGDAKQSAMDTLALAQAEIALVHDRSDAALRILEEHDPELKHEKIRDLFSATIRKEIQSGIVQGKYPRAHRLLRLAESHFPDDPEMVKQRENLFIAQYWPALILAGMFGSTFAATLSWLGFRAIAKMLKRWKQKRAEARQQKERESDARNSDTSSHDEILDAKGLAADDSIGGDATRLAFDDEVPSEDSSSESVDEATSDEVSVEEGAGHDELEGDSKEPAAASAAPYDEIGDDELLDDEPSEDSSTEAENSPELSSEEPTESTNSTGVIDSTEPTASTESTESTEFTEFTESETSGGGSPEVASGDEAANKFDLGKTSESTESTESEPAVEDGEVAAANDLGDRGTDEEDVEPVDEPALEDIPGDLSDSSNSNVEVSESVEAYASGETDDSDEVAARDEDSSAEQSEADDESEFDVQESGSEDELPPADPTETAVNDDGYSQFRTVENSESSRVDPLETAPEKVDKKEAVLEDAVPQGQDSVVDDSGDSEDPKGYDADDLSSIADEIAQELEAEFGSEDLGADTEVSDQTQQDAANDGGEPEDKKKSVVS